MGLFGNIFRGAYRLSRAGFYLGSVYTFFGYFYVQEIKHRLGDCEKCERIEIESIKTELAVTGEVEPLSLKLVTMVSDLINFYARTWYFRDFEDSCRGFHRDVISTVLRNYEEYGVLANADQMEEEIKGSDVNMALLTKVLQVKELNVQLTNLYAQEYLKIISHQINLRTGRILGMTPQ
jgi:hypothetical protein